MAIPRNAPSITVIEYESNALKMLALIAGLFSIYATVTTGLIPEAGKEPIARVIYSSALLLTGLNALILIGFNFFMYSSIAQGWTR